MLDRRVGEEPVGHRGAVSTDNPAVKHWRALAKTYEGDQGESGFSLRTYSYVTAYAESIGLHLHRQRQPDRQDGDEPRQLPDPRVRTTSGTSA